MLYWQHVCSIWCDDKDTLAVWSSSQNPQPQNNHERNIKQTNCRGSLPATWSALMKTVKLTKIKENLGHYDRSGESQQTRQLNVLGCRGWDLGTGKRPCGKTSEVQREQSLVNRNTPFLVVIGAPCWCQMLKIGEIGWGVYWNGILKHLCDSFENLISL